MGFGQRVAAASVSLATIVSLSFSGTAFASTDDGLAPLRTHSDGIAGSYVVVLREATPQSAGNAVMAAARSLGGTTTYQYTAVLDGFAAELPEAAVDALRRHPSVAYIEQDTMYYPDALPQLAPTPLQVDQTPPADAWGLDRIDQRTLPLDDTYSYTTTGQGVNVYVIDSGIRETHDDFGGRAEGVLDLVEDGMGTDDCSDHGTPVAGMIGGTAYGVAKEVQLKAVRIFPCPETGMGSPTSRTIAAIDWVADNHIAPAVANMSLNGAPSDALNDAAGGLVGAGVAAVTSAGDNQRDACTFSPRHEDMLMAGTMELTETGERRRSIANDGPCVDLFAPGGALRGPSADGDTAVTELRNGSSYSSPHVAGIVARLLQGNPGLSPAQLKALVVSNATEGELDPDTLGREGTPNLISYIDPTA
jgi:subtilisin family serine protease